ncbi:MAG TPA: polyprenyl synthetase family protein [Acidimicrobiales bacterium]|nr:polyprenyl synthetase family protein [Acidimicrobiales bacterium]
MASSSPSPLLVSPTMAEDLAKVEVELRESVRTEDAFLTEVASHLILAGGKRIRPGFTLASSFALDTEARAASREVIMGAVSVELVHLGSLYHDDVMDDAATRRTVDSVNARWGNLKAILAGDFLLAKASEIAAALGTEVAGLLANTIARLCEGQVRELQDAYNIDRTARHYFASIEGKTAALLGTACRIGGIVAELPRPLIDTLTAFGRCYGMAFQVVDDILDIVSTDEELGKPSGNDLVEGIYTLPVLHTLESPDGPRLRLLLGDKLDADDRDTARAMVRANGGIDAALVVARDFAAQAAEALEPLEGTVAAASLGAAAKHLIAKVAAAAAAP